MGSPKVFAREATGLVRAVSVWDAFLFNNWTAGGAWSSLTWVSIYPIWFPNADIVGALFLTMIISTLTPADLVATKLQVVEATEREYKDMMCLLLDHEIGVYDQNGTINGKYLARLAADDWGVYTTFKITLGHLLDFMRSFPLPDDKKALVNARINEIGHRLDEEPKSMRWKMRSRIGEKTPWYDLPEVDKKIVT